MKNRSYGKKIRLGKSARKKSNIPTWIVMRTGGDVRFSPFSRRHWRSTKLDAT